MVLLVIGIICLGVAIGCFFGYKSTQAKVGEILLTQTSTVAQLEDSAKGVSETLGTGNFNEYAELKGNGEYPDTLTSEIGKKECVYYKSVVEREWEEEEWVTNSEGKRERQHRKGSDTMSSNEQSIPFYLNDGTGRIRIEPKGAALDLEQSVDRFEPHSSGGGSRISFGGFSIDISGHHDSNRKTLGYRFKEAAVTKIYPPQSLGYTKMKPFSGWWSILKPIFYLGLGIKK